MFLLYAYSVVCVYKLKMIFIRFFERNKQSVTTGISYGIVRQITEYRVQQTVISIHNQRLWNINYRFYFFLLQCPCQVCKYISDNIAQIDL